MQAVTAVTIGAGLLVQTGKRLERLERLGLAIGAVLRPNRFKTVAVSAVRIVEKLDSAMKIIVDTRERRPFSFAGKRYEGVVTEAGSLTTGDYSLAGLTDRVAIERKELADLVQCLGRERERFERELVRAAALDCFCVVIEASWQELAQGQYRSQLNPHSACQSIAAFTARLGIPFHFAGSRAGAEYFTWSLLRQYLEGAKRRYAAIVRAHEAA